MIWILSIYLIGSIIAYFVIKRDEKKSTGTWTVGDREDTLKWSILSWLVLLIMLCAWLVDVRERGKDKRLIKSANRRNKLSKW